MTKYRKKPVVIEAVQFEYTLDGVQKLLAFVGDNLGKITKERRPDARAEAEIITLEDGIKSQVAHVATEGDWIIKGVQGEFYPVKPDIFEETYELVESDQKHVCGPYIDVDVVAHRCTKCGKTLIYEDNVSTDKLKFIGTLEALE